MIRELLCKWLGLEYKQCETCEVLKEQLNYERMTNKELTAAITGLVKPEPIVIQSPEVLHPVHTVGLWSKRRAELERRERVVAKIKDESPFAAKPDTEVKKEEPTPPVAVVKDDSIDKLEEELGLNDAEAATAEQNTAS